MKLLRTLPRQSQHRQTRFRRLRREVLETRRLLAGFQVPGDPTAADDSYEVSEDGVIVGNLLADDTGSGNDEGPTGSETLVLTEINGQTFTPNEPIVLPSGATLTVAADGAFTYDPTTSGDLSSIPDGLSDSDAFTYSTSVGFSELYVFGDSLSDIGNMYDTTRALGGGFPPPPYFEGRASDGPIWAEYLAPRLGHTMRDLSEPSPNNFAVYGAQTDDGNFNEGNPLFPFPGLDADGLTDELSNYAAATGGAADPDALYVVWAGANDFLNPPADPVAAITASVGNIANAVGTLKAMGAESIIVPNMPDLGLTPRAIASGGAEMFTQFTVGFNTALEGTIASFFPDVQIFDTFSVLQETVASGEFSNVTTECFDFAAGTVCSNPNEHLFWDNVHPTTRGHEYIEAAMYEQLLSVGPMTASDSATVSLTVTDVTTLPEAEILGPDVAVPGQPILFELSATDDSTADEAGVFHYAIDWNGDGSMDQTVEGPATGVSVTHRFATLGEHLIGVTTTDQDGDQSAPVDWTLDVMPVTEVDGDLYVGGTKRSDTIRFRQENSDIQVIIGMETLGTFSLSPSSKVYAYGLAGHDVIDAGNLDLRVNFYGGAGNDLLIGGSQDDVLNAGSGNDIVYARAGNDVVRGGLGNDRIHGGNGNDRLGGGDGMDYIFGGAGADLIRGNGGNDWIFGGRGNDTLHGNAGHDWLFGGLGDDELFGGSGFDMLLGGPGDDELFGGAGFDGLF